MSKVNVVMPQMGESITTGTITKWNKNLGDKINVDEILLEISTDKVESEIPSPVSGVVVALLGKEGDTIDVGKVIAHIDTDMNASVQPTSSAPVESQKATVASPTLSQTPGPTKTVTTTNTEVKASTESHKFFTPLVKSMAMEHQVPLSELENIKGSGINNRVNKNDFLQHLESKNTKEVKVEYKNEKVEIIPLDNMRKTIAKNMVLSKQTSPHVNSVNMVDVTHLVTARNKIKEKFLKQEGFNLTFGPMIAYAIVSALREFPRVNASLDSNGENLLVKKEVNLGVAVSVPGNGLVVPVIKKACTMNFIGICRSINELAQKARAKKLTMEELQGGSFTYTNVGSFGTLFATPIILQPQLGIYASGAITKQPVVMTSADGSDSIAIRSVMYGTHTYDHRMIDGELGGLFLQAVHKNLSLMDLEKLCA